MRQLLLMRHAKSSWDDFGLADFDRPLAGRGALVAPLMGREIASRGWTPDKALVSTAVRARDTWLLVAAEWADGQCELQPSESLYDAEASAILSEIGATAPAIRKLLIVGHNPGLQDLALQLAGESSNAKAISRVEKKFPTAAIARFEVDGEWTELDSGTARLTHFLRPKDLD